MPPNHSFQWIVLLAGPADRYALGQKTWIKARTSYDTLVKASVIEFAIASFSVCARDVGKQIELFGWLHVGGKY